MIDVQTALKFVLEQVQPGEPVAVAVTAAQGRVLAAAVVSDIDSPPHDKALMDGYAVLAADIAGGRRELTVIDEITAGDVPRRPIESGVAARIMTGAPIPAGADAVVMHERTEAISAGDDRSPPAALGRIRVNETKVAAGQNILPRATAMRAGEVVLPAGRRITAADVGLLCEVGCARPTVSPRPRVAVLPTGNELVPADQTPRAGQIRNSNGPMLCGLVEAAGGEARPLDVARDTHDDLRRLIAAGLEHDFLLLSGGVSAGILDLVPQVLGELGVREIFHKVRLKPGKPLWFGVFEDPRRRCLVFGLPGNPVSSLVGFELYVRPALARRLGEAGSGQPWPLIQAALEHDFHHRGDRPTYFPAKLRQAGGRLFVTTLHWHGSADLRTAAAADALVCLPDSPRQFAEGELVEVLPLTPVAFC